MSKRRPVGESTFKRWDVPKEGLILCFLRVTSWYLWPRQPGGKVIIRIPLRPAKIAGERGARIVCQKIIVNEQWIQGSKPIKT